LSRGPRRSSIAENPWFADNLSRLMTEQGLSNARLARWLSVSREIIRQWRNRKTAPSEEHFEALCAALQCQDDDLLTQHATPPQPMLPIGEWARREGIPCQRARDLFALRILTGEKRTAFETLVPVEAKAPPESKNLVLVAKRRPRWVPTFHANFPRLMEQSTVDRTTLGLMVGVQSNAVYHWLKGRNYPEERRLPEIAHALGISIDKLIGDAELENTETEAYEEEAMA